MNKLLTGLWFIIVVIACVDEDLLETQDIANSQLTPSYSLPIGHFNYDMNGYLDSLANLEGSWPFIDTIIYLDEPVPFIDSAFHFTDSVELRLAEMNAGNQYIESLTFFVRLKNYYPTEITYQVYFTRANRSIIDSVFQNGAQLVGAGIPNNETPDSIEPSSQLFEIGVTDHVINNIDDITDLLLRGSIRLHTEDTTKLVVRSDYHIQSDLSARIRLRYNTEDVNP